MGTIAYDQDFYTWTQEQAKLLREGKFDQIDLEHVIEEIEDLGKDYYIQLEERLTVLLMYLLKWLHEPKCRSKNCANIIKEQRRAIPRHLFKNPGLKSHMGTIFVDAYCYAREDAQDETGMPLTTFPEQCPWLLEQVLDPEFWPEPVR